MGGQVRSRLVAIERIQSQNPSQMPFSENQDMIQTVAPECPDQALSYGFCQGDLGEIGRSRIPL
jgi:hypothetical protein